MITGSDGFTAFLFFFFSVFAVEDFFAGKRLAAGFLVKGLGFDPAGETEVASWDLALNGFTALLCVDSGAIGIVFGDAGFESRVNLAGKSVCGRSPLGELRG